MLKVICEYILSIKAAEEEVILVGLKMRGFR